MCIMMHARKYLSRGMLLFLFLTVVGIVDSARLGKSEADTDVDQTRHLHLETKIEEPLAIEDFCSDTTSITQASCDEIAFHKISNCQKDDSAQCHPCGFKKAESSAKDAFQKIVKDGRCYPRNFRITPKGQKLTIIYHRKGNKQNQRSLQNHMTICDSKSNLSDWSHPDSLNINAAICKSNGNGPLTQKCFKENPLNILKFKNTSGSSKKIIFVMQVQIDEMIQCRNSECILQIANIEQGGDQGIATCLPLKFSREYDQINKRSHPSQASTSPLKKTKNQASIKDEELALTPSSTLSTLLVSTSPLSQTPPFVPTTPLSQTLPFIPTTYPTAAPVTTAIPVKDSSTFIPIISKDTSSSQVDGSQSVKVKVNRSIIPLSALTSSHIESAEQPEVKSIESSVQTTHPTMTPFTTSESLPVNTTNILTSTMESVGEQQVNSTNTVSQQEVNSTENVSQQGVNITNPEGEQLMNNTNSKGQKIMNSTNLNEQEPVNSAMSKRNQLMNSLFAVGEKIEELKNYTSSLKKVLIKKEDLLPSGQKEEDELLSSGQKEEDELELLTSGQRTIRCDWQFMLLVMLAAQLFKLLF